MSDERDGVPVSVAWILIASLAAAIFLTNAMRAPKASDSEFPPNANGLPVVTVQDAIEVQGLEAGSDIVVSGWYFHELIHPCEAPDPEVVPLLNGHCNIGGSWLMAEPEELSGGALPNGPAIHPVFDGPADQWVAPDPGEPPVRVVFVGHFDDPRAEDCLPESRQLCRDRFVVTEVPWADGVDNP